MYAGQPSLNHHQIKYKEFPLNSVPLKTHSAKYNTNQTMNQQCELKIDSPDRCAGQATIISTFLEVPLNPCL